MELRLTAGVPGLDASSSDLEIGDDGGARPNTVAVRFQNITIPTSSTILNAYIQFTGDPGDVATDISTPTVVVRGDRQPNAPTFSDTLVTDIPGRTLTTASVTWGPIPAWGGDVAGGNERTPNISAIVSEIISLPGWTSGNAMAFQFSSDPGKERTAWSFEGNAAAAPLLVVTFVTPPTPPAPAAAADWSIYE